MKLGHVVKAGLLAGAFATTAQAQTLTGNIAGSGFASATGVAVGPVCNISSMPTMLPAGRSCTFSNSGVSLSTESDIKIDGVAKILFNVGLNAYVYSLDYTFSGKVGSSSPNVMFAFDVPVFPMFFNYASSNIDVSASVLLNSLSITDDAAIGAFQSVSTSLGGNPQGSFGLDLNPMVTATRPSSMSPLPSSRLVITDSESSGTQSVNSMIDRSRVALGFDLSSTADQALFSGRGNVTFTSNVVPEPSTYALFATGLVGLLAATRRRRSV